MRVEIDNDFTLNAVKSNICMLYDEEQRHITTAVIGRIRTRETKGRKTDKLKCGSGFDCSKLPFARGHVIALEIGGSDCPYNVVPQFGRWQNKGAEWRTMEEEIAKTYSGRLMLVEIAYGRTGGIEDNDALRQRYDKNRFMKWTDRKIPDRFNVRIFNDPLDPSALTTEPLFKAAIQKLAGVAVLKSWDFIFPANGNLAPADEEYLARTEAGQMAHDIYAEKDEELKRGFSAASTYLLAPGSFDGLKQAMKKKYPDLTPATVDFLNPHDVITEVEDIRPSILKKKVLKKRELKIALDEPVVAAAGLPPPPAAAAAAKPGALKKAKGDH